MSIQTELTRLTNAKSAIKAAIEGKGVTVPDATLLDGMAALIESIEAGGGKSYFEKVTIAKQSRDYTMTHNLGVIPNFCFYVVLDAISSFKTIQAAGSFTAILGGVQICILIGSSNSSYNSKAFAITYKYEDDQELYEHLVGTGSNTAMASPSTVDENEINFYSGNFSLKPGTYLFGCGVADFGGIV